MKLSKTFYSDTVTSTTTSPIPSSMNLDTFKIGTFSTSEFKSNVATIGGYMTTLISTDNSFQHIVGFANPITDTIAVMKHYIKKDRLVARLVTQNEMFGSVDSFYVKDIDTNGFMIITGLVPNITYCKQLTWDLIVLP
jgi:hypothetical protein